jgi:putative solute:sodium symporter small subunit
MTESEAKDREGTGGAGSGSSDRHGYWRANLRVMAILLSIWFLASYGLGILFVEWLNRFHVGGFPLGFWFAQQGSIYVFVVLIFVYARWMDRIDARFGVD